MAACPRRCWGLEAEYGLGAGDFTDGSVAVRLRRVAHDIAIHPAQAHDEPRNVPSRPSSTSGDVEGALRARLEAAHKSPGNIGDIDGIELGSATPGNHRLSSRQHRTNEVRDGTPHSLAGPVYGGQAQDCRAPARPARPLPCAVLLLQLHERVWLQGSTYRRAFVDSQRRGCIDAHRTGEAHLPYPTLPPRIQQPDALHHVLV